MTTRPFILVNGLIEPMGDADYAQWQLDSAAGRLRSALSAVDVQLQAVLAGGASYTAAGTTYHGIQVDQVSQDRIQAMSICAGLVKQGLTTWPSTYSGGWLLADNLTRVPLATADAGIALAVAMNAWVGSAIVNAQQLKAQIRAAADPSTIDITQGWPSP